MLFSSTEVIIFFLENVLILFFPKGSGGGMNLDPININTYTSTAGCGGGLIFIGSAINITLEG